MKTNVIQYFAVKGPDIVPMIYLGEQEWPGRLPERLFNITRPLLDHPIRSTLAQATIESYGYEIL